MSMYIHLLVSNVRNKRFFCFLLQTIFYDKLRKKNISPQTHLKYTVNGINFSVVARIVVVFFFFFQEQQMDFQFPFLPIKSLEVITLP